MQIKIKPGKYVVAVSGGVDSVVLLALLSNQTDLELIVAHFDHGIREDSAVDRKFVEAVAKKYNLPFEFAEGNLGPKTSEAKARKARYEFLESVREKHNAQAIVTAHHQDDLLETAILNMLRGTKRKGLVSLKNRQGLIRPLLGVSKNEILDYANEHKLTWREDPTNIDEKYLRNYVRHTIVPKLSQQSRGELLEQIKQIGKKEVHIDKLLSELFEYQTGIKAVGRLWFVNLPHAVAKEYMAYWLAKRSMAYDKVLIEKLVVAAKTLKPGKKASIDKNHSLHITKDTISLE